MQARSILPVCAAMLLVLAACGETDRPLTYKKGVYGGKEDQKLTEQQLDELRQRARQYQ